MFYVWTGGELGRTFLVDREVAMRCLTILWVIGAVSVSGCSEETCARACRDSSTSVDVFLEPIVERGAYDVALVLDEQDGAFTCDPGVGLSSQTGSGQLVARCDGAGFAIAATPDTIEATFNAREVSWTGSIAEELVYERAPRCPGGDELCPPYATVAINEGATVPSER